MERIVETWTRSLLDLWQSATLLDYLRLGLAVVVTAWFIGRYGQKRARR